MPTRLLALTMDAREPDRLAAFWAGVLTRDVVQDGDGLLLPGSDTQVGLRFAAGDLGEPAPSRVHLHLTSAAPGDQSRTVAAALELGAAHLDVGQRPEEGHIVLGDPEGNPFCVIEAGNAFLSGCGFLGELACDGTRDVGLFWSRALDWPLVWDESGETAVQSPVGGTKVAWGGPPVAPKVAPNRQRFDVTTADVVSEADRLVALGATLLGDQDGTLDLADPDGNEFRLRSA